MNISEFLKQRFPEGATVAAHASLSPASWYEDGEADSWSCSPFEEVEEIDGFSQMDGGDFFSESLDCEMIELSRVAIASPPPCDALVAYQDPAGGGAWVACLNAVK